VALQKFVVSTGVAIMLGMHRVCRSLVYQQMLVRCIYVAVVDLTCGNVADEVAMSLRVQL
jgi:hypothetical protein